MFFFTRAASFILFILPILIGPDANATQVASSLDSQGNLQFTFNNDPSLKIGSQTAECNNGSEGAIRYNKAKKNVEFCDGKLWRTSGGDVQFGGLYSTYDFGFSGGLTCSPYSTSIKDCTCPAGFNSHAVYIAVHDCAPTPPVFPAQFAGGGRGCYMTLYVCTNP